MAEHNRWIYDLIYCGECGCHVPVFRDLAPADQAILDAWKVRRPVWYAEIARQIGLDEGVAKAWLLHLKRPIRPKGRRNSTPCPQCGRWLRSPAARQCFHCGADWHQKPGAGSGHS